VIGFWHLVSDASAVHPLKGVPEKCVFITKASPNSNITHAYIIPSKVRLFAGHENLIGHDLHAVLSYMSCS